MLSWIKEPMRRVGQPFDAISIVWPDLRFNMRLNLVEIFDGPLEFFGRDLLPVAERVSKSC